MEITNLTGWVVVLASKNGRKGRIVCPVMRDQSPFDYYAIGGYGEIFYSRKRAKEIAEQLSKNWGTPFVVKKAQLAVI